MNKTFIFNLVMVFMVIHLFGTHSKLIYHLNPDFIEEKLRIFSFTKFNENTITAMVFALAYSIITASILIFNMKSEKYFMFILFMFALLDCIGVFVYYNTNIQLFTLYGASYYALFTFFIVISIGLSKNMINPDLKEEPKNSLKTALKSGFSVTDVNSKIIELRKQNYSQNDIASIVGVSQAKVSRILKKSKINIS